MASLDALSPSGRPDEPFGAHSRRPVRLKQKRETMSMNRTTFGFSGYEKV